MNDYKFKLAILCDNDIVVVETLESTSNTTTDSVTPDVSLGDTSTNNISQSTLSVVDTTNNNDVIESINNIGISLIIVVGFIFGAIVSCSLWNRLK